MYAHTHRLTSVLSVRYPHALFFLELLQDDKFRKEMAVAPVAQRVLDFQVMWRHCPMAVFVASSCGLVSLPHGRVCYQLLWICVIAWHTMVAAN